MLFLPVYENMERIKVVDNAQITLVFVSFVDIFIHGVVFIFNLKMVFIFLV